MRYDDNSVDILSYLSLELFVYVTWLNRLVFSSILSDMILYSSCLLVHYLVRIQQTIVNEFIFLSYQILNIFN